MSARFRRVLVVDDERFFRDAIQDVLSAAGLECILAADGPEALELAEEPSIGAVVLDVRLPGPDGLEVLRRLREMRPHLPVIMLSAHQDQAYVLEALRTGACDYLAKPLHEEELVLAVRRALEGFEHAATSDKLRDRLAHLQQSVARLGALARDDAHIEAVHAGLAEAVADVLVADKTSLMLLDGDGSELRVAAATGRKLEPGEFTPVPVGEGVAGLALARSEPLLVTEVSDDERFAGRDTQDRYRTHSFAVAPIVAGDRALGVLCATDAREGGLLDAEDLALLRILAEQAAQVLSVAEVTAALAAAAGNAREPEPEVSLDGLTAPLVVDDASDEGELARAVCEAVVAEVEPGRVLAGALAAVGPALGASSAAVFLRDPAGELAREAEWCDEGGGDRVRLALGVGLTGTVLETGRPVVTDDPSADPRFQAGVDTPANERPGPLMCLPLVFRGKTLGVFRAFPATAGQASPRVGEVLGAALSAAVRTVLLYRSLVESIEEVARVRREARDPSA